MILFFSFVVKTQNPNLVLLLFKQIIHMIVWAWLIKKLI